TLNQKSTFIRTVQREVLRGGSCADSHGQRARLLNSHWWTINNRLNRNRDPNQTHLVPSVITGKTTSATAKMDYYAYTNPSYSDDEDEDQREECDYCPVNTRYTFLESITEETSDELLSEEESQTSWDETSDDEAVSVIHNDSCAKTNSNYPIPTEETNKGEQLDKWLEHSISLGERERCAMPAFDLDRTACFDTKTPLDETQWSAALDLHLENHYTRRSSSLEDFLIKEFEVNNDDLSSKLSFHDLEVESVECFNGFVKCCHARSLSDLTQSKTNDNLSEDSGFCDAAQAENDENEKKTFAIEVILEEDSDYEAPSTSYEDRDVNLLLREEWERSLESGRAATDDWLGLKIKPEMKMGKKSCSLRSLELDIASSDDRAACKHSESAERQLGKEARDQEGSRITSACSDSTRSRHMEGWQRKYTNTPPNWERRACDGDSHLAVSQGLVPSRSNSDSDSEVDKEDLVDCVFGGSEKGSLTVTSSESMSHLAVPRAGSIPRGVHFGQTPAKFQKCAAGLASIQNCDPEKVHVMIVNGKEGNERTAFLRVKEYMDLDDMQTSTAITLTPRNDTHHSACHQVERVNLDDDHICDTATRALEDSYHHMERAINYLQQDIYDRNTFYLHEPPINPSRNHIWNARQQYFDQSPPQPDINRIFDDFRKRAQDGRERAARSVQDLQAIDSSVRQEMKKITSPLPEIKQIKSSTTSSIPAPSKPRGEFLQASKQRSRSASYLETDIDSLLSRQVFHDTSINTDVPRNYNAQTKALSMLSLRQQREEHEERARSMEFLLDADNKVAAQPPENQLMYGGDEKRLSEAELRVRKSLRQLNVPEWFKNSPYKRGKKGFLLKKRDDDNDKKWQGLSSKTPSAPSVSYQSDGNGSVISSSSASAMIRINPPHCWRYPGGWSREDLHCSRSTSPMQDKGHGVMRWEGNSISTGSLQRAPPTVLTKQPYLGWRSSERLTRDDSNAESTPTNTSSNFYRSAAERLSAGPGYYALRYGSYASKPSSEECLTARTAVSSGTGASPTKTKPTCKPQIPIKPLSTPTVVHQNGNSKNAIHGYSNLKAADKPKSSRHKVVWMESSFVGVKPTTNNGKHIQDNKEEMNSSSFEKLHYEEVLVVYPLAFQENESKGPRFSLTGLEEVFNLLLAIPTKSSCSKINFLSKNDNDIS
uniref:Uncharacterized protein n=1 Tax=Strigamia maritima TaxID=126957 RepID=T1IGQ7_STRMM